MPNSSNETSVTVRVDTYRVLKRVREDLSYATFDMVIRRAIVEKFPEFAYDLD